MGQYEDWLAGLKVGDKVVVEYKSGFGAKTHRRVSVIERITPTRQIKVRGFEEKFRKGEYTNYTNYNSIRRILLKLTPELEKEIRETDDRDRLARKLNDFKFHTLPYEKVKQVADILGIKTEE